MWVTGPSKVIGKGRLRGFTLIELLVVILLIATLLTISITSFRSLTRVHLKETANQLFGLIRETYYKAALSSKAHRLVFDMDEGQYWLEVSNDEVRLPSDEGDEEGGHLRIFGEEDKAKKYAKPPTFVPEEGELGKKQKLPKGIRFFGFWADNMQERVRTGQVALYFFPGGSMQNAQITLTDDADGKHVLTLVTDSLTGEVVIENVEPEIEK